MHNRIYIQDIIQLHLRRRELAQENSSNNKLANNKLSQQRKQHNTKNTAAVSVLLCLRVC